MTNKHSLGIGYRARRAIQTMSSTRKIILLLILLGGGYSLWRALTPYPPKLSLTPQEVSVVDTFLQGMSTRCVGRYLIDMPASFASSDGNFVVFLNDIQLKISSQYPAAFAQKIQLREQELQKEIVVEPLNKPFLKQVHALPTGMTGVIFERNLNPSPPDAFRILEAHYFIGDVAIEINMKANNASAARYEKKRQQHPDVYYNNVPQRLAELIDLLQRISVRQDTDIPRQPGLCLPNLFIADGNRPQQEEIDVVYDSSQYPELDFNFSSDNLRADATDNSLLARGDEIGRMINAANGRTLRKGKRHIHGVDSEEWLMSGNLDEKEKGLRFLLHANEANSSPTSPMFRISVEQRGITGKNQLSESAAVSAWQQITETLRPRPGAFKK